MDKNIKLSELIRIGSKITEQCSGLMQDNGRKTCAIGAALTAKRGEYLASVGTCEAVKELGIPQIDVKHPAFSNGCYSYNLAATITILNDKMKWTREKIADWLESIGL